MRSFPFHRQLDSRSCGSTCLKMIAKYYGKSYSSQYIERQSHVTKEGASLQNLSSAAEAIGFKTLMARMKFEDVSREATLPLIAHWRQNHFVIVYKIKKNKVWIADPAHGLIKLSKQEFIDGWGKSGIGIDDGVVLLLEPTHEFYKSEPNEVIDKSKLTFILKYLRPHRRNLIQLVLGLFIGSILQVSFPLLTQSMVDIGINHNNLGFVNLILIAQLVLYISKASVDFIRSWVLFHLGTHINISILTDFLIKLMKLPISFFDSKQIGDLLQRINDHRRVESFLTSSVLNFVFSSFNFIVFGLVLAYYDLNIFSIFLIGSTLYVIWIIAFMKKRRELDYLTFNQISANQSTIIQLITGMQEIKLHNAERDKRWEWERGQAKLYKANILGLSISQYQQAGSIFINESKNIFITFLAARSVIEGDITFGMMLAIQYIIGQLNAPINELIGFIRSAQDAKISLERLNEIHSRPDEEEDNIGNIEITPQNGNIHLNQVSFNYEGAHSPKVLDSITLTIPVGKVTAIVGESGSGKSTLLKLLLKFYKPSNGSIQIDDMDLSYLSSRSWREKCGAVMQEGFFFSDTIAKNIVVKDDFIDLKKLLDAVDIANIRRDIESFPMNYNTMIGANGRGLSQGQKQRLLIARAVYKNPDYLFFDEATNSLDATNERIIVENLKHVFKGKTVFLIAHRLSTVMNADQIVVLDKGKVIELGNHLELVSRKGKYYELIKNQLELGN